jgi:hypothetical protein
MLIVRVQICETGSSQPRIKCCHFSKFVQSDTVTYVSVNKSLLLKIASAFYFGFATGRV